MAVDMFLKIDGIKGESADKVHKAEIEVLSWSWGVTQSATTHSGSGGGSGKANVQDITITKWLDAASPKLLMACLVGTHVKEALLTVRKAGERPLEYVKIKLSDALVSSVQTGGAGSDDRLTETIGLNFAKVYLDYSAQKADGSGEPPVPMAFDIAANVKL